MLCQVLSLGIGHRIHYVDRREFVFSHPPGENFSLSGCGIEGPLSCAILLEWNWKRVIVRPYHENFAAIGLVAPAAQGLIGVCEVLCCPLIVGRIAGEDKIRGTRAEDCKQRTAVVRLCGGDKRGAGVVGCGECFWTGFCRRRCFRCVASDERQKYCQDDDLRAEAGEIHLGIQRFG